MEHKQTRPIALLTDFGHQDAFTGILKGVILSVNPGAVIADLSHGVEPGNIFQGSFLLSVSSSYFPKNTIFCVIVDPGVGSLRKPVLIRTEDYFFIGPDNGVMWQAASSNKIIDIIHLTETRYFLNNISATFHGRDIFAPVAAHLSCGLEIEQFGQNLASIVRLELPCPEKNKNSLTLTVLNIDVYGNISLNIRLREFETHITRGFSLEVNNARITHFYDTYSSAGDNTPFLLESSSGYLEISVKNNNAARILGVNILDKFNLFCA